MSASNYSDAEDPGHAREIADRRDAKRWRKHVSDLPAPIVGEVMLLSCELDGEDAPDGRAYITIEVSLEDARRCPMYKPIHITEPKS